MSFFNQNFVSVLHCLIDQLQPVVWTIFLIFDAGYILAERLLRIFQLAFESLDVRVFDHLIIGLLVSNSPSERLYFMIGLALNTGDLLFLAKAPNLVDVLEEGIHEGF